jgi:hypothetical protein
MVVIPNDLVRKAIESRYDNICSVYVYQDVFNEDTKQTKRERVRLLKDIPCRLSYQTQAFASLVSSQNEGVPETYQSVKMFIAPELDIPENSEIEVQRAGRSLKFKRSSVPVIHTNHQEVMVEVWDQDG